MTPTPIAALDVSAASGLCELGGELHVIADDELALRVYDLDGTPRRRVPLLPGTLPTGAAARKKAKPDLEALCVLPGGALLALGSGSTAARDRGALVEEGGVRPVDLGPLYRALRLELPELNIEGAACFGPTLRLLSRGNGARRENALVELELASLLSGAAAIARIVPVELPELGGILLTFTDASPCGEHMLFAAAAEDTLDPYLDGACTGSAIGLCDASGRVLELEPAGACKLEGITRVPGGELRLCNDADDPSAPAWLFGAPWPASWGR